MVEHVGEAAKDARLIKPNERRARCDARMLPAAKRYREATNLVRKLLVPRTDAPGVLQEHHGTCLDGLRRRHHVKREAQWLASD